MLVAIVSPPHREYLISAYGHTRRPLSHPKDIIHTDVNDILIEKIKPSLLVSAAPDASLAKLAGLIHDRHIHRIVIVEDEKSTGIFTTSDIRKAGKEGKIS